MTELKKTSPLKSPVFWMLVVLLATAAIVPTFVMFALAASIFWFGVRSEMSRPAGPMANAGIGRRIVVVLAFILFFVVLLLIKYL